MGIVPPRPLHPRGGGQSNSALLALMKKIESEIAQRHITVRSDRMQLVPYEELERYSKGKGGTNV